MIAGDIGFVGEDYCRFFVPRIFIWNTDGNQLHRLHGLFWALIGTDCTDLPDGSLVTRIYLVTGKPGLRNSKSTPS